MVECDVVRFPNRSPLNHCLIILQCCGYLTDHAVSRAHNWEVPRFLPDVHFEKLDWEKVPLRLWGNQGAIVRKVLGDPHPENLDYDHRMPPYVPIDARQFCYTRQNLHEIDRNEARYRAVLDRWEKVQREIETEMSDAEQLRPETKPHIAAHYRPMMTINEGDEDQIDFDTGAEHITNDMDYSHTKVEKQLQATRNADTGESQTRVVDAVVSNAVFDPTALENYSEWIVGEVPDDRDPDQWAAYEDS